MADKKRKPRVWKAWAVVTKRRALLNVFLTKAEANVAAEWSGYAEPPLVRVTITEVLQCGGHREKTRNVS